jgi:thiol-disulfide isomerase/thioredoxin
MMKKNVLLILISFAFMLILTSQIMRINANESTEYQDKEEEEQIDYHDTRIHDPDHVEDKIPSGKNKRIVILDAENYQKKMKQNQNLFVFFYGPMCKFSQNLSVEISKVATFLADHPTVGKLRIAQFNVNREREIAADYGVEGTPKFLHFERGNVVKEYEGARNAAGLLTFILNQLHSSHSIEVKDDDQINNLNALNKYTLIFSGPEEFLTSYQKAVEKINDEVLFGHRIIEDQKLTVMLFKEGKEIARFKAEEDNGKILGFDSLSEFISLNLYDKWIGFTQDTSKLIFTQGKPGLFIYCKPEERGTYENLIQDLNPNIRKRILIFLLGVEENHNVESRLFSVVQADHRDFPSVKIHQRLNILRTQNMRKEITIENVQEFVDNWFKNGFVNEEPKEKLVIDEEDLQQHDDL